MLVNANAHNRPLSPGDKWRIMTSVDAISDILLGERDSPHTIHYNFVRMPIFTDDESGRQ